MWLLLHGGGPHPSRHLQRHPHHLPAQTGRTVLLGLRQHRTPQGLPTPMKMKVNRKYWAGMDTKVLKRGRHYGMFQKLQFECKRISAQWKKMDCCLSFSAFTFLVSTNLTGQIKNMNFDTDSIVIHNYCGNNKIFIDIRN